MKPVPKRFLGSLETGMMGEEDGHGAEGKLDHSMLLTDPEEAADFVKKTGVDALSNCDWYITRRVQIQWN